MDLALTIQRPDEDAGRSLQIEIDGESTGQELVDSLAAHLLLPSGTWQLWNVRTRMPVASAAPIAQAELLSGDTLKLADPAQPPAWAHHDPTVYHHTFELLVVGGPRAGQRFPLVPGEYIVGRDESSTIAIQDDQASRRHVHLGVGSDQVMITDLQSTNGTLVDGRELSETIELRPGAIVEVGSTLLSLERIELSAAARLASIQYADGHLDFNRPPRVRRSMQRKQLALPNIPVKPPKRKLPLAMALAPLLMGGAMAFVVGPVMLLFSLMGPVMAMFSLVEDRRGGHKAFREDSAKFEEALVELQDELAPTHDELVRARREAAPSPAHLIGRARSRSPELWERRLDDNDFLTIRIGLSNLPTNLNFTGGDTAGGEAAFADRIDALRTEFEVDPEVPVDVDLRGLGVLGVTGPAEERAALVRWLMLQPATLDSPRDLALVVLAPAEETALWEWTKWLPHTSTLVAGLPGAHTVAADPDDIRVVFQIVDDLIVSRRIEAQRRVGYGDDEWSPHVLVVIPGDIPIPRPALSRVLQDGRDFGVTFIVAAARSEQLPGECKAVVTATALGTDFSVTVSATGDTIPGIVGDGVPLLAAHETAISLAPVRDISAASASGEVPRQALLLDILDLPDPSAASILQRWQQHAGSVGLGAPIGIGPTGPVTVDLRRDGPHGLAAGTTGAGKSELLQSLVASLAASHPANRLTFVLVDYKGGAAFKDCVALPHTVGFFTDLDAHLAQRALVSLNAELRRREHILSETGTKDIIDLERRDPARAPANLFIVFDEFAFLKKEVPEFVAGVIDIAQRGRSLGVHLMLATQRPQGVVDDNIRANTNLRIALRIADEVDSNDVIDRPDAAHIPKSIPGRAFIRTGHSDVQVVQSAYAGAISSGGPQRQPTKVKDFGFTSGMRATAGGGSSSADDDDRPTDLQRLVTAIGEANEQAGIPAQPLPWLPPLEDVYDLGSLLQEASAAGVQAWAEGTVIGPDGQPVAAAPTGTELSAVLGRIDIPEEQTQGTWELDLGARGHVIVYGTSGTGKTTLLRTLAASLASKLWPTDLHLYCLDFASRGLRSVADLPHCGGVVNADEVEKVERLLVMLDLMVDERKSQLGAVGASSLAEYRATHGPVLPYVVVLIDGYAGFTSTFMEVDHGALIDRVARLVAEGRAVGLHFAISADRRNAIPSTLSGVISERIVLRMADRDEYATLGLSSAVADAELPPGRGFVDDQREVQFAILGEGTSGAEQSAALTQFGEHLRAAGPPIHVPRIELLRDYVRRTELEAVAPGSWQVPLGISGDTYGTSCIDLDDVATFMVLGPDRSGRSSALVTMTEGLFDAHASLEAYLLAPRRTALTSLAGWTDVAQGLDACEDMCAQLAEEVRARIGQGRPPFLIVLDDGDELVEGRGSLALETIVKRGRDAGVRLLVSMQTHVVHRSFGGWPTEVRKAKHGLFFVPDVDIDGELFGVRLPKKSYRSFPPGRAYVVRRGMIELVQVADP